MTNYLAGPATMEKTLYDLAFIGVFLLLSYYFRRHPVGLGGNPRLVHRSRPTA